MDSNASVSAISTLPKEQTTLISQELSSVSAPSFPKITGYFDFSMQGKLLLTGEKRLDLLQGLTTNDLSKLLPGQSTNAFMLDKFGKILTPLKILEFKKHTVLFLPFLQTEKIQAKLQKDAILQECQIENITFDFALLSVIGKKATKSLEKTFGHIEPNAFTLHSLHSIVFQHKGGVDKAREQSTLGTFQTDKQTPLPGFTKVKAGVDFAIIKQTRLYSQENYDLLIPKVGLEKVMTKLKQNGIIKQDPNLFALQRIKDKIPEWETDFDNTNNPLELNQYADDFISDTKGCYVGQEIIARLKHRANGQTAKKLCPVTSFNISKQKANKIKTKLSVETINLFTQEEGQTKIIGRVTSVAYDPLEKTLHALAFVNRPYYEQPQNSNQTQKLLGQEDEEKIRVDVSQ